MISFETDLSGIQFGIKNSDRFEFISRNLSRLQALVKMNLVSGSMGKNNFKWELKQGDFRESFEFFPPPDLIYYDLYSPKVAPELWSYKTFRAIYSVLNSASSLNGSPLLITYCSSTAVRTGMLLAGFCVGHGESTTQKKDTTLASLDKNKIARHLDKEWLNKWKRSSRALPFECEFKKEEVENFLNKIIDDNIYMM